MKNTKLDCPKCGNKLRKIETCYNTKEESKTSWTCDNENCLLSIAVIYIHLFKQNKEDLKLCSAQEQ